MRMIKTYEGMTMNCDVIATIQSVFMNITTGSISEMVDDGFDPDTLEFAVTAFTTLGDEIVLAVYATEEERDYARYKLENWLVYDVGSYYTMTEKNNGGFNHGKNDRNRVRQTDYDAKGQGIYTENHVSCRRKSDPLCSVRTA